MFRTPASLFRVLAIAEAISWTLLITGLILRATAGLAIATTIGGAIHGFVFLSYGATAVLVALNNRWRPGPAIVAIVSAKTTSSHAGCTGRLAGEWRTSEPADPVDRRWYDGLLRWFLRRPWVLAVLIVLAVVALFTVLLILGPPGGR